MSALSAGTIRRILQSRPPTAPSGAGDHVLNAHLAHLFSAGRTAAAVMILLVEREEGLHVLITRRAEGLPVHAGQYCCPGGRAEPDDAGPAATALRELQEEVGIDPAQVRVLGALPDYVTRTGFVVSPVVGAIRPPFSLSPSPGEVAEIVEIPLSVFLDPARCRVDEVAVPGGTASFYAFAWEGRVIWGATAGILVSLRDALRPPAQAAALRPAL